jgi:hypothetical protein
MFRAKSPDSRKDAKPKLLSAMEQLTHSTSRWMNYGVILLIR